MTFWILNVFLCKLFHQVKPYPKWKCSRRVITSFCPLANSWRTMVSTWLQVNGDETGDFQLVDYELEFSLCSIWITMLNGGCVMCIAKVSFWLLFMECVSPMINRRAQVLPFVIFCLLRMNIVLFFVIFHTNILQILYLTLSSKSRFSFIGCE